MAVLQRLKSSWHARRTHKGTLKNVPIRSSLHCFNTVARH
ncbi:hypothetical protein BIFPSEUDO_02989 [Bifidobacterium pseudocatenulatum DSM 20438 = JCM 1200 = LMG 10505]|uniref:Uncharacterized protein n=1 Tax=Bifidobacterium pseudocatenulatum DSM 20438 = JCM 1200 = LMG 10505 TaxID=547043 RepID=C0BS72_BIFPS|nr:hypothetical protein BIFPSEUDO_02989 [Bifidobacterium pseudocatenulatum DSM 20438 = JCM 1200 = LMG 10505]